MFQANGSSDAEVENGFDSYSKRYYKTNMIRISKCVELNTIILLLFNNLKAKQCL